MNNATNLVIFDPMYETDEGLEYINPADTKTIQEQIDAGRFRLAFHFQSVDCAAIHAVTKRNEVFPSLYNTNKINENWKKKIPLQLHFN